MKNLKKVLALVVALTMVLGTVSFAFTDVAEDSDVYTAVQTLSSLSILNGYEDGTFGPEKDITRAEFATVVCRALGLGNPAKGATQFADVPADHWAAGYINLVAGQGIVNGYGDGNFGPEDNVTYEQAVKMLVVALGYEPMASQKGGYPTGYLVVANTYGLTEGVNAPADAAAANRGVVAHLTYNALDIPVMAQTGFGTNVEFKIHDGISAPYKTLLSELDVEKLDGVVIGTSVIGAACAADEVYFDVKDNYDSTEIAEAADTFKVAEGVDAAKYFGYASTIYVKEVKNNWEIIAIMPGEDSATVELDKGDLDGSITTSELKYFETVTATKSVKLNLEISATSDGQDIVINNKYADLTDIAGLSDDAEIKVIENTGDSKYDMLVIKDYKYDIIDTVDVAKDRFTVKVESGRFIFDFEDDTVSNVIVNKDGEAITLADFEEGDVIAYILQDNKKSAFEWIEVINLGQNVVTGTITEANSTTNVVYVDGVEYELSASIAKAPTVNDEGIYFLTPSGKIFASEIDKSVASNYGYILEMDLNEAGFSAGWQIKILTKEGKVETFDVKDTWYIGIASSDAQIPVAKDEATTTTVKFGFLADVASDGANGSGTQFKVNHVDDRIITYKLDGNGKIREINPVNAAQISALTEYNADSMVIANHLLEEDATIFNLVGKDMDSAFVTTMSSLVDEGEYAGWVITNTDGEKDCFVITNGKGAIDLAQDIAVVDSVNTVTVNDEEALKVRYYTAGDDTLKEVTITVDTSIEHSGTLTFATLGLVKGDIIMIADDGNGIATSITKVADVTADKWTLVSSAAEAINAEDDLEIIVSYIKSETKTTNGTNITVGTANGSEISANDVIVVKNSANGYTYDYKSSSRITVTAGDWYAADTISPAFDKNGVAEEDGKGTYFLAIVENGIVSDIITHSVRGSY